MPESFASRYGPWALVTGASSGIGEQFTRQLAARGLNLVITARRADLLEHLAAELRDGHGVQVHVLALDLSHQDFLSPLMRACAEKHIGLVVSNAGFGLKGEHHQLDPTRLTAMLNVNCHAPMLLAHAFAPKLIARGRGGLLFTGSIEGFIAFPWSTGYAATKAFVMALGEGLWGELRTRGVDVMVLAPGSTDTDAPKLQGIDRSQLIGLISPQAVARQALDQLGQRPVLITGRVSRLLIGTLRALPRRLAVQLAGKGIKRALERSARGPRPSSDG